MGTETLNEILNLLKTTNIPFKHVRHKEISGRTSKDAATTRGTKLEDAAKALIIKTKKGIIIQAIIPANKRLDTKKLKKIVGEKNVSLTSPEEVLEITTCSVGSVPPFGILWNIPVYFDSGLVNKKEVVFSAGTHTDSIYINPNNLVQLNKGKIQPLCKDL